MPRAPEFWRSDGLLPRLLAPLAMVTAAATARRMARPGWRAPVAVVCCGNVTVGGAGKTTLALDLGQRLLAQGRSIHFLLRGYGGAVRGPHRVSHDDTSGLVGDEALLLAELAPTWIGADRAASARAAVTAGADILVLDDGLQNPTLCKDLSLLVVDAAAGFGNGRVLPAGPLREPIATGAARCQAAVLIGDDTAGARASLPPELPVLRARLEPQPDVAQLSGCRVLAFAGIASPDKFFATLRSVKADLAACMPFADHHRYTGGELARLVVQARQLQAVLVTTAKDYVRLPEAMRQQVRVVHVGLVWENAAAIDALLAETIRARPVAPAIQSHHETSSGAG